jgi:eukaryotic-like serine/threonine-protein kinase
VAHRAGIVHRDLKPSNVMLARDGVKLLDFGLAKLREVEGDSGGEAPTMSLAVSQEGIVLGTLPYMAPEQVEGKPVDARTDLFALGAVLYEMTTARPAFHGNTRATLIAAIVDRQPKALLEVQPLTPPMLEHVVVKCLEKDPDCRWQSAYDIAEHLRWLARAGDTQVAHPVAVRQRRRERVLLLMASLVVAALVATAAWFAAVRTTRLRERSPVYQLTVSTPPGEIATGPMALSPDGQTLASVAYSGGNGTALLVRKLSDRSWQQLNGTFGAYAPFWSPDGKQIAYFTRRSLWKFEPTAPARRRRSASWNSARWRFHPEPGATMEQSCSSATESSIAFTHRAGRSRRSASSRGQRSSAVPSFCQTENTSSAMHPPARTAPDTTSRPRKATSHRGD